MKQLLKHFPVSIAMISILLIPVQTIAQSTAKMLTNADVLSMIKAGLPESTIVLSIQRSPGQFDTNPQTLVTLKKQGVSPKILESMLQKQAAPAGDKATPTVATASVSFTGVQMILSGQTIQLKRAKVSYRYSTGLMQVFTGFGDSKVRAVLEGTKARFRITERQPSFEITLEPDINAEDYIKVVKLEEKSDRRSIEVARIGFGADGARAKEGFADDRIIPLKFEELPTRTETGKIVYRVTVSQPMVPGEYAFVQFLNVEASATNDNANKANAYDFGVDGTTIPTTSQTTTTAQPSKTQTPAAQK